MNNIYSIKRIDEIKYDEDFEIIVCAKDEKHAERAARLYSINFKKAKLNIAKIEIDDKRGYVIKCLRWSCATDYYLKNNDFKFNYTN